MGDLNAVPAPKVSVIIPAYNQAQYLDEALQSVFAQTFRDVEILVVNDGSTDDTAAVAQRYAERIRYLYQENQGLAGARNTGILAARGELVALLDADDMWLPGYLEAMVSLADKHAQTAVFYCAAQCVNKDGLLLSQIVGTTQKIENNFYQFLLRSNFLIPSTITMRRSVVVEIGLFAKIRPSGCEDWELWLRMLSAGHTFYGVTTVLARYRVHSSSMSTDVLKMQSSYRMVVEKHFGEDDQQYQLWSDDKRAAYGGFYRYQLLTNIQRQNNWHGAELFHKAAAADPSTSRDISFYYELALGSQPVGYRGTPLHLDLEHNAKKMENLLSELFSLADEPSLQPLRAEIFETAYKAIGLAAYNSGHFGLCRKYLRQAVAARPALLREKWVAASYLKSYLGLPARLALRKLRRRKMQG